MDMLRLISVMISVQLFMLVKIVMLLSEYVDELLCFCYAVKKISQFWLLIYASDLLGCIVVNDCQSGLQLVQLLLMVDNNDLVTDVSIGLLVCTLEFEMSTSVWLCAYGMNKLELASK